MSGLVAHSCSGLAFDYVGGVRLCAVYVHQETALQFWIGAWLHLFFGLDRTAVLDWGVAAPRFGFLLYGVGVFGCPMLLV